MAHDHTASTAGMLATLRAAVDTVIPADGWPAGWEGGVGHLVDEQLEAFPALDRVALFSGCAALDAAAVAANGRPFAEQTDARRRTIFAEVADSSGAAAQIERIVTLALQGFYAGTSAPAGWAMLGFDPGPTSPSADRVDSGTPPNLIDDDYDVIVIGAGAGGGVAAAELASKGERVLLIDRARPMRTSELRSDHLRGKRMQAFETTAGPGEGNPRLLDQPDGSTVLLPGEGDGGAYGLTAMTLGGGTRLWQGMSWRFYAEDFAMASTYGAPEGSTLIDWPFGYDELEPYYDRIEWELGVSGDANSDVARRTPRSRPYPMPALASDPVRVALGRSADQLGWKTSPVPFAINSVARDGRPACASCGQCVGHACPVNAKNGTQNTFIPRALATDRCHLLLSAQATSIVHDDRGLATGVRVVESGPEGDRERFIRARTIVVAAGAIESARLLLASGLGNDWVGRNHHTHGIAIATALEGPGFARRLGPGHSVASVDWVHRDRLAWGGGVIFDAPEMYPYSKAMVGRSVPGQRWGREHKRWMRESASPLGTMSMVQEIPHESSRVGIDGSLTDRRGMPVARLGGVPHEATREAVSFMVDRCVEWLEASGGRSIVRTALFGAPQGAEHSAGTLRMANDPADGACSPEGLLFGTTNVYVADASLHPTNGGFNPGLTVMANALRVATLLAG